jgi:hypothetical protein
MDLEYIVGIGVLLIALLWTSDTLPKKYRNRNCMGKKWKSTFPNSGKEDIREFLLMFTDAFAFSQNDKLKFEPDDKILVIYRELYPSKSTPDSLEVETLIDDCEKKYSINFNDFWHDNLTLGELYTGVKNT